MKAVVTFLAAALLTATVASADSSQPGGAPERNRAVMLYFAKSFGSTQKQNRTPLAFGLRLEQGAPLELHRSVAIADFRYSLGGVREIHTFGALAMRLGDDEVGKPSSSSSSGLPIKEHPVATGVVIGLGILGLACATETGLCKGGRSYERTSQPSTPTGPG